jgi:hypothetical protein
MRNLYFQRSNGTYLLIKENIADEQEGLNEVSAFLKRHNYTSHYTRIWTHGDETTYDVGSWSEFFKLAPATAHFADKVVGTEANFIDKN